MLEQCRCTILVLSTTLSVAAVVDLEPKFFPNWFKGCRFQSWICAHRSVNDSHRSLVVLTSAHVANGVQLKDSRWKLWLWTFVLHCFCQSTDGILYMWQRAPDHDTCTMMIHKKYVCLYMTALQQPICFWRNWIFVINMMRKCFNIVGPTIQYLL